MVSNNEAIDGPESVGLCLYLWNKRLLRKTWMGKPIKF